MTHPRGATLAIVGAGGHGKVVADAALLAGWQKVAFFDDAYPQVQAVEHWPVLGTRQTLINRTADFSEFIVAIGNNAIRADVHDRLESTGLTPATVLHPRACLSPYAQLGAGTVVLAGAVVNAFAQVGKAGIINTGATVDHDSHLDIAVHVSPGAHLGGDVRIGAQSWIGIGAIVKQGVTIGDHVTVGAGAVVVKDLLQPGVYIGCPAQRRQSD